MNSFEHRVAALESSLRRWRAATVIIASMLFAAFMLGTSQAREMRLDRLRAKHISVENEGGGFIELSANNLGGATVLIGGPRQRATVRIFVDESNLGLSAGLTCRTSAEVAGPSNAGHLSASDQGGQIVLEKAEQGQSKRSFEAPPR